ncbi:MAG: mechanosensitive ion channel family protein [Alphaproteobacteria bacterium]|nr:mechanosensitive ion channel family protein [Alphaproteobacteria bacterium]
MDQQIATISKWWDVAAAFLVAYSFQIIGAIVFFLIGLKVAQWVAGLVVRLGLRNGLDATISNFAANVVRILILAMVIIATLGNFGISIAPLIALLGAGAFGATVAIQGPLSNYGAGLTLILTRPFAIGDTVTIKSISGVVEDITLAATFLVGEDGERIMVPNRQIVGEILVNSRGHRIVEHTLSIAPDQDIAAAIRAVKGAIAQVPQVVKEPAPEVGVKSFSSLEVTLALRYWAPARAFFSTQFAVNLEARAALTAAGLRAA